MKINQEEFHRMLVKNDFEITRHEADHVFESFDNDRDGFLTVYDFTSRASRDHVAHLNFEGEEAKLINKKNKKRTRNNARSAFPSATVFSFPMPKLITSFRQKMELKAGSGETWSDYRAFRYAMEKARFFDRSKSGKISPSQLQRWLDSLDFPVPSQTIQGLMKLYPSKDNTEMFDYLNFLDGIYPECEGKVGRAPPPPPSTRSITHTQSRSPSYPLPRSDKLQPMGIWSAALSSPSASASTSTSTSTSAPRSTLALAGSMTARAWTHPTNEYNNNNDNNNGNSTGSNGSSNGSSSSRQSTRCTRKKKQGSDFTQVRRDHTYRNNLW
jgi:Ca2+-binding EF-hand superfamily protein